MTPARRIASRAPRRRRTGPGSGWHVPHPGPAPGPTAPCPTSWRRRRTAAARTRSARPGTPARQGPRPGPRRGRAPGTGYHRWGRRGVPHGAPQQVAPPAQQHVPVDAGLVARLVEGERAGGSGIGQADDVHAAGGRVAVVGEGRAAGDHRRLVPVDVGPVLFQQLLAQRHGGGPVAVVAEELHAHSLAYYAGDPHHAAADSGTRNPWSRTSAAGGIFPAAPGAGACPRRTPLGRALSAPPGRSRRRRGSRSACRPRRPDPSSPAHRRRLLTGPEGAPHTSPGSPRRSSTG